MLSPPAPAPPLYRQNVAHTVPNFDFLSSHNKTKIGTEIDLKVIVINGYYYWELIDGRPRSIGLSGGNLF